ncbi:MAG: class I SAM-dependent methyltransferase [Cytophagaceae bacterium]|nr:class I SAM-dependent methyltransferase [Cytophagaceae bacterium]
MENQDNKQHWEKVFTEKKLTEVSWYQEKPDTSLELINSMQLNKDARIIDIGAGDSLLIDNLLDEGYTNIYALDISAHALDRAKERLGKRADLVKWIVSDITKFKPDVQFDFWHDRAAFHFLTEENDINSYINIATNSVKGYLSIGTFSTSGPEKCSGLQIKQYSQDTLKEKFKQGFATIKCFEEIHPTPFGTKQNFTFCLFKKQ